MKLKYTPEAIKDIQEIQRYIKNTFHNPAAAKRISKMILAACSSLKVFPESGVSIESKTGFQTDLRMLICEKWIAVYRIEGSSDVVSVSRIIDGGQDYMRILRVFPSGGGPVLVKQIISLRLPNLDVPHDRLVCDQRRFSSP